MLFTADGLEQATRLEVAAQHAQRFRAAGVHTVHDLGCGIGADAMAMAGLDLRVRAIDADEVTAAIAAVNLRHWPDSTAEQGLVEQFTPPAGEGAARRRLARPRPADPRVADATGRTRRLFRLDEISPSWERVQEMARALPATGAKMSPAFPHAALPAGVEAQWTSYDGEVLECALWWGPLAHTAGRTAAVLGHSRGPVVVGEAGADPQPPPRGAWPTWHLALRARPCLLRAGTVGAVTAATGGGARLRGGLRVGRPLRGPALRPPVCRGRGDAVQRQGAAGLAPRPRGGPAHHQEAWREPDADLLRRQLRMPPKGHNEALVVISRVLASRSCSWYSRPERLALPTRWRADRLGDVSAPAWPGNTRYGM